MLSTPAVKRACLVEYNDRLAHWLSALHSILPLDLAPRTFTDAKTLTRRVAMLEQVFEYILNLTNQLNARVNPQADQLPIPPSVFEVYTARKEQQTHIIARLKNILNVANIPNFTTAETFEAAEAHGRILDLKSALENARDPAVELPQPRATRLPKKLGVRRTERVRRTARGAVRVAELLPTQPLGGDSDAYSTIESSAALTDTAADTDGVVRRTTAGQQVRGTPPRASTVPGIQPLLPRRLPQTQEPVARRDFCAGQHDDAAIATLPAPTAQARPVLPSIKYVWRSAAMGEIDRLAVDIRNFEIEHNLGHHEHGEGFRL
ncbi:hypothetical protein C8F04DRAFT_1193726 [Mycena alexandri]|uniref:Uncharacterized protein n=1 Tax=Mycena alexandri TaxID=1745969 RepID=A0AAD6S8H2_9AGAR|nr:hypothetical protein C8F04DRAFT_1193726 [Mycena alexandri]